MSLGRKVARRIQPGRAKRCPWCVQWMTHSVLSSTGRVLAEGCAFHCRAYAAGAKMPPLMATGPRSVP